MTKRTNLLITTIGRLEYYKSWISEERNYDIALIYYPDQIDDKTREELEMNSDFLFFNPGFKYPNLKNILLGNPQLLEYEYYWMPDHDVMLRRGTVNAMFDYMKEQGFEMAQPSLVDRNRSWKLLVNKPQYEYRFINFLEVMNPMFSQNALQKCLESFSYSNSGWGLGLYWGKIIPEKKAVMDRFLVEHMEKMDEEDGPLYRKLFDLTGKTPRDEKNYLVKKYDLETTMRHIAKIPRKGTFAYYLNLIRS